MARPLKHGRENRSETGGDPFSPSPTPESAPESTPAVWEDFIDVIFAPATVFERRKGWSAWPVLVGLTAVLVVLFISWQRVLGPVMDLEMAARMAEAPDLDPAQIDRMRSAGRIFGAVGVAVAFPLGVLIMSLVTWGLGRLFGSTAAFGRVLGVVVYSQVVRAFSFVAGILHSSVMDVNRMDSIHDASLSLARFLDQTEASAVAVNLAARVDVFVLWATVLVAIGLRVATGLSRGSAWAVAALVWLLAAAPTVAGALMGG